MKLKVQIVEDDPLTAHDLKEILIENQFDVIGISNSYQDALKLFYSGKPDLLLADIGLKGEKDGIELVSEINNPSPLCPVIYLTANSDTLTKSRAFNTNPAAFLTKPFNISTVIASLELAVDHYNKQQVKPASAGDFDLFVKKGDKFSKINTSNIVYLEAEGSYCKIITTDGEYIISGNLKLLTNKLVTNFIRTHRSYLINKNKVTAIDSQNIYLGKLAIAIGRRYKNEVRKHFNILH